MRLLVCFAYYIRGQRILPWISGCGAILIALGLFASGVNSAQLVAIGTVFFAGFPILVGGLAYRQLIANRRVAMVPDIRYFATGALFLLAFCAAALMGFAASRVSPAPDAWWIGVLAFSMISVYLVVSQWFVSSRAGALSFFVLPFIALGLGISSDPIVWARLFAPSASLALAGLAWLWLAIAIRSKGLPRYWLGTIQAGWGGGSGARGFWQLPGGRRGGAKSATSGGTLMRGGSDGWSNRSASGLMIVLLFPVVMSAVIAVMGILQRNPEARQFSGEFLLLTSFLGVCTFPAMIFAEWPVRLRLLWLRVSGDRSGLWRRLERNLFEELLFVTAIATCVAAGFLLWSDVPRELVYLYLSGSVLMCLASSYLGFCARISGWHSSVPGVLLAVLMLAFLAGGTSLRNDGDSFAVFWLLPLLGILALAFRTFAHERFQRIDWCAVRPQRFPRRPP